MATLVSNTPMTELDEWDDFVATRYKEGKSEEEFRNYKADANPGAFGKWPTT
jgi:inositol oxygenase